MEFLKQDEGRVWLLFKNGDNQMFTSIYSKYSRKLYHYGLKFTQNRTLIEDSIQDLFFELLKNRKTIGQTDNILRYLLKSFRFKLFRLLKYEKRFDLRSDNEEYAFEIAFSIEHEMILQEEVDQKSTILVKALQDLTPRQKEAIYLKYTNALEYTEVSEIMDMSLESCRNLIYRAVKALKEVVQAGKNL
ncbi:MAG: sigma-70 family RNA polymerase sigma factor [Bacteroidia bacterium]|nr:sigma-70 family RNA polymerase sigma factor [Bacteroidia bacterium]